MNELSSGAWIGLDAMRSLVRGYLRPRLSDENDVEDVVQEALLRAARFRDVEREPQSLRAWMLRIAENALTDHRRRLRRRKSREIEDEALDEHEGREDAPGEGLDDERVRVEDSVVERQQLFGWMADALAELDSEDQFVLDSYYAGDAACPTIARSLALEPALVKTRLFRARQRVREHVRRCLVRETEEPIGDARSAHVHDAEATGFRVAPEDVDRRACAAEGRSRCIG
jgi:RNA polymerase sigma-70 factor, ECF subfamily